MNIDLLAPTQREAWDMQQNGMSVAEIARQLSRNPKTVSERLKRAKEKMDQNHLKMDEITGIIWYQVAAACARDHHAVSDAYISNRLLSSMVFDLRCKRFGYDGII